MKILIQFTLSLLLLLNSWILNAQDTNILLKEADNLEKQLKESEALDKYKQILIVAPTNIKALVKTAELNVLLGGKEKDKNAKRLYYESAYGFARRSLLADSNNADANYALAMSTGKLIDIESENKKIVAYVKDVKTYSDKAISINPNHAKANYSLGKWHYEMVILSGIKKVAVKLFYGGLPDGDLDKAILYMEKCKTIEPYFAPNYLDLAKAYKEARRPANAIEVLNKLVKLPNRSSQDIVIKAEGVRLLESLQ
jgi:hypothetical protein